MLKSVAVAILLLPFSLSLLGQDPVARPVKLADGTYVGEIRAFAGHLAPDGWIVCDGKQYAVNAQTQQLYNVIGTLWGSTQQGQFRVPDLRGQFLRGWNMTRTVEQGGDPETNRRYLPAGAPGAGGANANRNRVGSYQLDEMRDHKHLDSGHSHGYSYQKDYGCGPHCGAVTGPGDSNKFDGKANIGGPVDHAGNPVRTGQENRPRNVYVIFAIRNAVSIPPNLGTEITTPETPQ